MARQRAAEYERAARPTMPEAYDAPDNPLAPHARAFGAGLVDPMGLPSWLLDAYAQRWPQYTPMNPATADWYRRRMQEARDESPVAAGVGSSVLPFLVGGGAARAVGELTTRELLEGLPIFMQFGAAVGGMRDSVFPPPTKKRPQGSYPPSGAY
jgi:hypothetical protein